MHHFSISSGVYKKGLATVGQRKDSALRLFLEGRWDNYLFLSLNEFRLTERLVIEKVKQQSVHVIINYLLI